MAEFKIVEDRKNINCFYVKIKKHWWTPWRYVRRQSDKIIATWDSKRGAQAYINLHAAKLKKD